MKLKVSAVVVLALVMLAGCSATNVSELVKAMGNDPASSCLRVNSIYATLLFARTAIPNGAVTCNSDGMSVRSDATGAK